MAAPEPRMRWWGWGVDGGGSELPAGAAALLKDAFGVSGEEAPAVDLSAVSLPDSPPLPAFSDIVGAENVRSDPLARVSHAVGRSYPDLVRIRSGDGLSAPAAVLFPAAMEEVAAVLALAASEGVSVVPFGGGTSVVGGVTPTSSNSISLDLARMNRLVAVDHESLTATFEPGLTGPEAEEALAEHGFTIGHFPQSFEYATIGGFVATRSAGQASTGYGRIDELVRGLKMVTPAGELEVKPFPGTAAGPQLRDMAVGSEGVLGVITEATLRVRPAPESRCFEAWRFGSFAEGVEVFRRMEQAGAAADVQRLSDEAETALSLSLAGSGEEIEAGGCLAITGWEGTEEGVARRREHGLPFLEGATSLGKGPGEAWLRGRYRAPYLRDDLLARGVMVETLETSAVWSNLHALYGAVGDALREALGQAVVMCHVSHLYPTGASLYFTFIAGQDTDDPLGQWRRAKTAACDAIAASGGTITHHHAIGADHAPWMAREVGEAGLEILRAAKERLDPAGIMNPGKLIPPA